MERQREHDTKELWNGLPRRRRPPRVAAAMALIPIAGAVGAEPQSFSSRPIPSAAGCRHPTYAGAPARGAASERFDSMDLGFRLAENASTD